MSRFGVPFLVALLLVSCGDSSAEAPTGSPSSSTSPSPATTTPQATTPTTSPAGPAEYTVADCDTPPVPFALLCDVYEHLAENHADAPLSAPALAAGLAVGIEAYEGTGPAGDQPRFQCAIPDPAFESACQVIADRLRTQGFSIEPALESGVASMIELSLDPFTFYLPPELSGALTDEGIISAVGLLLTITDPVGSVCTLVQPPCRLEVVAAIEDGPAYEAGIEGGDDIQSIGGEPVAGAGLVDVAGLLDGETGTTISIEVVKADGQTLATTITRSRPVFPGLEFEQPVPGVGYLRIPDFDPDIPAYVHSALTSLDGAGIGELVIDLRDNPGGSVDAVTRVASEFLDTGLVFRSFGPAGDLGYTVVPGGLATSGIDLTVVVNAGSASASEILAGVLQETGRARLVGTPTFGKNTVQIGFRLRNDGELRVTIARWETPGGISVAVNGLTPDVAIDIPEGASAAEVVELALDN